MSDNQPLTTTQEIISYLQSKYDLHKNNPSIPRDESGTLHDADPAKHAYGDALYLCGGIHGSDRDGLVRSLKRNKKRVHDATIAYPSREWRKKTCNYYQIIIDRIEGR